MSVIRLLRDGDFDEYARQSLNAYPVMMEDVTPDAQKTWKENMKKAQVESGPIHYYGVFRDGKMVGGGRYHDFVINLHGALCKAGGIGNVFVDLLHKKEHVAKQLMEHFHSHYRAEGVSLVSLYPFRPDFYRRMGYGYGRKLNQYKIKPGDLPQGDKSGVGYLTLTDSSKATECYNRYTRAKHGMIIKPEGSIIRLIQGNNVIGFRRGDRIEGLARIKFARVHPDNPLLQNITVSYLIYENSDALRAIIAFLGSQHDQVDRIIFETFDDDLHFLPSDPRDGEQTMFNTCWETNRQAVGIMYRVINTRSLFNTLINRNFNGVSTRLKLTIRDSFLPENDGSTLIQFKGGEAKFLESGRYDVEVKLDVEWFSSLIMGVVDLRSLHLYGLVKTSENANLEKLRQLFYSNEKPITMEEF